VTVEITRDRADVGGVAEFGVRAHRRTKSGGGQPAL